MTVSAMQGQQEKIAINTNDYTKFIIDSLARGIQPVYERTKAGQYAPLIDILLEDYNPDALDEFNMVLDALKNKHKTFKDILAAPPCAEENSNPDYVSSKKGEQVFKRYKLREVLLQPDIDWLVSGILQRATTSLVIGEGNVGKTFVWLDLAMHMAYSEKWLGRNTRAGRVLYIYAEGRGGLKQRARAWLQEHNKLDIQGRELEENDNISFIPRPVHLLNDRNMLYKTIEDEPEIPELVVIDTFSMCASGVEENSNSQVAMYLATATDIKQTYGCHVTIVHHMNKSGGFRGASVFRDNVDTMLVMDREDDEGPIKVECKKQRDGEYFPPFFLKLKVVKLGINPYTNEPVTSCVVEPTDKDDIDSKQSKMSSRQERMLDILSIHGSLSSGVWQKRCELEAGIDRNAFNYQIKALLAGGYIASNEYYSGKQKRVNYSLVADKAVS
jgi:hypothetical protein